MPYSQKQSITCINKRGTTPNFFQTKFSVFLHIRKKHKKRKFLRLIWALSDFRGPRGARKTENAKYGQKLKKGPIFNIFQKFQKCVNKYPILYQNAKFGGPRVKNVDFRVKKRFLRVSENTWYLRLKFFDTDFLSDSIFSDIFWARPLFFLNFFVIKAGPLKCEQFLLIFVFSNFFARGGRGEC